MDYIAPIAFALFLWWFSTGVIFYLDNLPVRTFKWSMTGATLTLVASLVTLGYTADKTDVISVYLAFSAALLVWGFQEISLYMGVITGPRKIRCEEGCSGIRHFGHAIAANLYHEISIILGAIVIYALTKDADLPFGFFTYIILWGMHLSARLNVFLGVRNVSEDFVPAHMDVMKSFLNKKPMNMLFPVSVTIAMIGTFCLVNRVDQAQSDGERIGYILLATMMVLALIEHWMLVLPVPVEKLWNWSLPDRKAKSRGGLNGRDRVEFRALASGPGITGDLPAKSGGPCC
jgi:putative photosynthetic complex assembly protein 2